MIYVPKVEANAVTNGKKAQKDECCIFLELQANNQYNQIGNSAKKCQKKLVKAKQEYWIEHVILFLSQSLSLFSKATNIFPSRLLLLKQKQNFFFIEKNKMTKNTKIKIIIFHVLREK